jgi:hypothetical protein
VRLVPKNIAEQTWKDIVVEQSILLTLLPDWELPARELVGNGERGEGRGVEVESPIHGRQNLQTYQ